MEACVYFSLYAVSAYFTNTQEQLNVQVSIVALVCMQVVIGVFPLVIEICLLCTLGGTL